MPDYLYHVTPARNLEGIADHGLRSGSGASFGGYAGHAQGRVFLAERDAVRCWWGKIQDLVEHHSEGRDIVPELQVPVVLRVRKAPLKRLLTDDELGSRDCIGGKSFFVQGGAIEPGEVSVWDGRTWSNVRSVDPEEVIDGDEDGEEGEDGWTEVELRLPGSWPW
jgi:hypothetical protein